MGMRLVRIAGELFQHLLTEGTTYPNQEGYILKVTKGLPEGAKLVGIDHRFESDEFILKYFHPDWSDNTRMGDHLGAVPIELGIEKVSWAFPESADKPEEVKPRGDFF